MPNWRLNVSIFNWSWVSRHCTRRASSGCAECSSTGLFDEDDAVAGVEVWARRERIVSCTPGAEGAEVSKAVEVG